MPQGRRKVPFSGKKKKEQLMNKRQAKAKVLTEKDNSDDDNDVGKSVRNIQKLNYQSGSASSRANRYALHFYKETKEELEKMKEQARLPFIHVPEEDREVDCKYFDGYDFPIRPEWKYSMSKEELDRNENQYFISYIKNLEKRHSDENKSFSFFELNLETWRQLWRVLEFSDILLIVVDIRYSTLMFPPSLYDYITKELGKKVIIILNKIDLVEPEIVIAWKDYFVTTYPDLSVVLLASYPVSKLRNLNFRKRKNIAKIATEGVYSIFKECRSIVGDDLDLSSWEQKILEDLKDEVQNTVAEDDNLSTKADGENYEFNFEKHTKYKDQILTIGCIGFPNVGKSSLINALKGRKVVSVSRTPGHTKHFQTIFLTKNVKICDCPGLVFPSSTPKYIQVLLGSFPIAQLREPYSSIKYLGERIDLPTTLSLQMPPDFDEWSAIGVCEAWALKRGFLTAKASRPDHYRAANNLLQLVLAGRIAFNFYPLNYTKTKEKWTNHEELESIRKIQNGGELSVSREEKNVFVLESSDNDEGTSQSGSESNDSDDLTPANSNAFGVLARN